MVEKLIAGESISVGSSVNALTKDTTFEKFSAIPTVSDLAELKVNILCSNIERESLGLVKISNTGRSARDSSSAFGLPCTK